MAPCRGACQRWSLSSRSRCSCLPLFDCGSTPRFRTEAEEIVERALAGEDRLSFLFLPSGIAVAEALDVQPLRPGTFSGAYSGASTTSSATDSASANWSWKTLRAAGRRARLERGDQLARAVAPLERQHRLADRRRVVREVVDHGHAARDAAHLLPAPHAQEAAHRRARSPAARRPGRTRPRSIPTRFSWL